VYSATDGRSLLLAPVAGGRPRRIAGRIRTGFLQPAGWSPDGRSILFSRSYGPTGAAAEVLAADVRTGRTRRLGPGFAAAWSPDGSAILYTPSFFNSPLFVMAPDGSEKRRLVATAATEPDWR
jgi:Tol biopolymer transport system component